VIEEQTALAQRQADLAAQRLEAEVRRPADAEAYRQRTLAEAERDRAKFQAEGEAYRTTTLAEAQAQSVKVQADGTAYAERTTANAQAEANNARATSLKGGNQEVIAANRLIEVLPQMIGAAAQGLAGSNLTILNGTDGVTQVLTELVGQGLAVLDTLKRSTNAVSHNGSTAPPAAPAAPAVAAAPDA